MDESSNLELKFCRELIETVDAIQNSVLNRRSADEINLFMRLSISQARLVRILVAMTRDNPGGVPLKELAEQLNLSSSAVSVMVENLVHKGILERLPSPHDRRMVLIRLDEAGRRSVSECESDLVAIVKEAFKRESEADRRTFCEMLSRFHDHIKNMKGIPK